MIPKESRKSVAPLPKAAPVSRTAIAGTEFETTFLISQAEAQKLLRSKLIRRSRAKGPVIGFERRTYYDTPRNLLKKHGLSLTVRQKGDKFVQTIKAEPYFYGGALSGTDLSKILPNNTLDVSVVKNVLPSGTIKKSSLKRLKPVFHIQVQRTKIDLAYDGAVINMIYDNGHIISARNGKCVGQISELKAVLKSGPTHSLFTLLSELNEKFTLQQLAISQSARGYAVTRRTHALRAQKHKAFSSETSHDAYEVLHNAIAGALAHFFANNPNFVGSKPDAIHQTRVAVRRMRAILRAFKDHINYMDRKALNGELRWLQSKLGECRDWHVLRHDTAPKAKKFYAEAAKELDHLAKQVHARRLPQALAVYNSRRAQRLILQVQLWVSRLPQSGGPDVGELRRDAMLRNLKKLNTLGRLTHKKPIAEIHAIRILAKKMRYSLEIFPRQADTEDNAVLKSLKNMQELLGDLNDAAKCLELLSTTRAPGFVPETHANIRHWAEKWIADRIDETRPHYNKVLRWGKYLA